MTNIPYTEEGMLAYLLELFPAPEDRASLTIYVKDRYAEVLANSSSPLPEIASAQTARMWAQGFRSRQLKPKTPGNYNPARTTSRGKFHGKVQRTGRLMRKSNHRSG